RCAAPKPRALGRWTGRRRLRVLGSRDGGEELLHAARRSLELRGRQPHAQDRSARRSRQRAVLHDRVHGGDALPGRRRGRGDPDARSRAPGGRAGAGVTPLLFTGRAAAASAPATSDAFKADVVLLSVNAAQATLVFEAALK